LAGGDLPGGLSLRPVLLGDEQIELEVTGPRSGSDAPVDRKEGAAGVAATGSATVRMRSGQTVAIRGLGGPVLSEEEKPPKAASLAKALGLGKTGKPPRELVLFITPEPTGAAPPVQTAARPSDRPAPEHEGPSWLDKWIGRR
jgi:hypothetical protein